MVAVGADFVGFGINFDFWRRVVPLEIFLGDGAAAADGFGAFAEAVGFGDSVLFAEGADESDGIAMCTDSKSESDLNPCSWVRKEDNVCSTEFPMAEITPDPTT